MFPTTIEGVVRQATDVRPDGDAALREVERRLRDVGATAISRGPTRLSFATDMFRNITSWNLLYMIDRGQVSFEPERPDTFRFEFSCRRSVFLVSALVASLSLFVLVVNRDLVSAGLTAAIAWLGLVGLNYVVASVRLRAFMAIATGRDAVSPNKRIEQAASSVGARRG